MPRATEIPQWKVLPKFQSHAPRYTCAVCAGFVFVEPLLCSMLEDLLPRQALLVHVLDSIQNP